VDCRIAPRRPATPPLRGRAVNPRPGSPGPAPPAWTPACRPC